MALKKVKLGDLLELCDERNSDLKYDLSYVRGISTKKEFIITKADMTGVKLDNYKIVFPGEIAYVSDTSESGYLKLIKSIVSSLSPNCNNV